MSRDIPNEDKAANKLGSALARQSGDDEGVTIQRLFQQLSVALMKGNAALFNNRRPANDMEEVGNDVIW